MSPRDSRASGYAGLFTLAFTGLVVGQIGSILGDRLHSIAFIELLTTETQRFTDPGATFELSKLALAMTLPAILLGPFAGAFIDRVNRKRVLIVTDVVRGAAVLAIPFLRPALPLWTVYGVVALLYLASIFFLPARCAIVSEMVPRESLIRANSVLSLGATLATIAGFSLGGIIATRAGWRTALFVDAAVYFGSAAALTLVTTTSPAHETTRSERPSYLRIIKEAFGEIGRTRGTRVGVLAPPFLVMAGAVAYVLGVAIVEGMSPEGTMHVGFLVSLAGIGMALGCYITGKVLSKANRARVIVIATVLSILPLMLIGLTRRLVIMGLALTVAGFMAGPVFVSSETSVQEETPQRRQGTVFAVRDMSMKVFLAVGAGLAAAVATRIGFSAALVALLAACLAVALPVLLYKR
jgi:predicted MFS family arabinose efflux permease